MGRQRVSADAEGLAPVGGHGLASPVCARINEPRNIPILDSPGDEQASAALQAIARSYGIQTTGHACRRTLFRLIFERLSQSGHEHDLAAWFAYRVYRDLVGNATASPLKGPNDPLIQVVARQLVADARFIESIRTYQGADLIWFGRRTGPDGITQEGGDKGTTAYRRCVQSLRPFASNEMSGANTEDARRYRRREDAAGRGVQSTRWHAVAGVALALLLALLFFALHALPA